MNRETKDLANSSAGGAFPHLRVSRAKEILGKLLGAKRAYDNPRDPQLRLGVAISSATEQEDKMELRMDKMEKALITAIEKNGPASPTLNQIAEQKGWITTYDPLEDMEALAQVNAAGYWNQNNNWNPLEDQGPTMEQPPKFQVERWKSEPRLESPTKPEP